MRTRKYEGAEEDHERDAMIESIHIRNFQSHKDTTLDLSGGVNVIVGSSDSGKSAILRALNWLVFNRPSGDDFRSDWGGDTIVSASFAMADQLSQSVSRIRTKKDNMYSVEDGVDFRAMNKGVPIEVDEIIRIREVNVQRQLDSPYLLSLSPADVARHFNSVAHLEDIDETLRRALGMARDNQQSYRAREDEAARLREELETYKDIEDRERDVAKIENANREKKLLWDSHSSISGIIEAYRIADDAIKPIAKLLESKDRVIVLARKVAAIDVTQKKRSEINRIGKALTQATKSVEMYESIAGAETEANRIKGLEDDQEEKKTKLTEIDTIINQIQDHGQAIAHYESTVVELEAELPEVCPTCGSKLNHGQKTGQRT